jgi:N-succinyldiaminopimelate aminotransferase
VVFGSLSKRSNVPGMRSGYVAGDAALLKAFLLYRTYHGSAMSPAVQAASEAAWRDEAHVVENRRLYREKFDAFHARHPARLIEIAMPDAGFYFWLRVGGDDAEFARRPPRTI